jgi:hypothetical protein
LCGTAFLTAMSAPGSKAAINGRVVVREVPKYWRLSIASGTFWFPSYPLVEGWGKSVTGQTIMIKARQDCSAPIVRMGISEHDHAK